MELFKERIDLYTKYILENTFHNKEYFEKQIYENNRIIRLLENDLMTPEVFSRFNSHYKWDIAIYLKNVLWCCQYCLFRFTSEIPDRTFGVNYCPECDEVLTYRTGGGQGDPFNYTFKFI